MAVPCSSVPMFAEVAHGLLSGSQVELREALEFEQTGAHILSFFSLFSCRTGSSHRDLFYMHEDILLAASSSDKLDVECGDISTQETHLVNCLWVEAYSFFFFWISTMSCHGPGHSHILVLDRKGIDMRWYLRLKRPLVNYLSPSSELPWRGPYLPSRLCIITSSLAVQADASLHTIWFGKRTKYISVGYSKMNAWYRFQSNYGVVTSAKCVALGSLDHRKSFRDNFLTYPPHFNSILLMLDSVKEALFQAQKIQSFWTMGP